MQECPGSKIFKATTGGRKTWSQTPSGGLKYNQLLIPYFLDTINPCLRISIFQLKVLTIWPYIFCICFTVC